MIAAAVFTNAKTTLAAVLSAAASFVLFSNQLHPGLFPFWVLDFSLFASLGGTIALGIVAKDVNVTGGTTVQPGIPVAEILPVNSGPVTVAVVPPAAPTEKPKEPPKW